MKLPAIIAFAAIAALVFAEEPQPEPAKPKHDPNPWKVHVEMQVISLPEKAAFSLLPALRDPKTIESGRKEIETLLGKGEARMVAAPIGAVDDGGTVTTSQTEEVRFAIEYEGPTVVEKERNPGEKSEALAVVMQPSTFDTRAVGVTLTVAAEASADGETMTLDTTADHTWHLGWTDFEAGADLRGNKLSVRQPKFATAKTLGRLTLRNSEPTLLSIHKDRAAEGRMELFIFRAWTTPLPKK